MKTLKYPSTNTFLLWGNPARLHTLTHTSIGHVNDVKLPSHDYPVHTNTHVVPLTELQTANQSQTE